MYLWQRSCYEEALAISCESKLAASVASKRHTALRWVKPEVLSQLQGRNMNCEDAWKLGL